MTQYSGKVIRKTPVTPTQTSASGVWKLNEQAAAIRNNSWPVPGVPDPISRSLRFRSSASAYLNRTPGTPTDATKWTYSVWVKRGSLTSSQATLLAAYTNSSNFCFFMFNSSDDTIRFYVYSGGAIVGDLKTTAVYRDPSAWYNILLSKSGTTFTLYVNGVATSWSGTAPPSSVFINTATPHYIGQYGASGAYLDGYMTEINFIDGQALTPSSFGTTDTSSGAWIPMPYTGTYGANGFYLNFKDNTSTTTLGYDYSGNANNWTTNNISLTSGSTYDSMLDVPTPWVGYSTTTDTSAVVRGNYPVLNPVEMNPVGTRTISNGNLDVTLAYTSGVICYGTMGVPTSGKYYWEVTATTVDSANASPLIGVFRIDDPAGTSYDYVNSVAYRQSGVKQTSAGTAAYGNSFTNGDIIGIAVDSDNQAVYFSKNGVWQNSGDPTSGASKTGAAITSLPQQVKPGIASSVNSTVSSFNFGQRPLSYSPPSGYKTLCTTNLPTPTITNGANYFAASTYTGNGSTQTITNSGNNTAALTFQPDFVWAKNRTNAIGHALFDSVRGTGLQLVSNSTGAETNEGSAGVSAFNSNGFSVGSNSSVNQSTASMVAWQWKAGGASGVVNSSGSITSTVSANTTAGFSVVTYTGVGGTGTVGHGLGIAPSMIIVMPRSFVSDKYVYHASIGAANYVSINLTSASASTTLWNSTSPTSSVFTVNGNGANQNTSTFVAYCFAAVAGYSAFGSYTGNGSADGPFIYLGFRPRYVMYKRTDTSGSNWVVIDTSRDTYNYAEKELYPSLANAENTGSARIDILSNGYKIRSDSTYVYINASGGTYIYAAFAEVPFKFANSR